MKLIYIRSTMEPKNYSTIRGILKKEQGEKIAPYIFKINDTQILEAYLRKEKITYVWNFLILANMVVLYIFCVDMRINL